MCLTISGFETREKARQFTKNPKIAEKDITVYKVINKEGYPPFYSLQYVKGFHYYQTGDKPFSFNICKGTFSDEWILEVNVGLHSCKTKKDALDIGVSSADKIVKMIIPKGSKYFENQYYYVSDQLIYI